MKSHLLSHFPRFPPPHSPRSIITPKYTIFTCFTWFGSYPSPIQHAIFLLLVGMFRNSLNPFRNLR